jgi:hypothetical protein
MEELVAFYKEHKEWFILALAWLLAIPGGIITNRLDDYLKNRSLTTRERKIKALLIRYINIKNRKENNYLRYEIPTAWSWLPFVSIGLLFIIFILFPDFTWFRLILVFIVCILVYYSMILLSQGIANSWDTIFFERFKRRIIKKLRKLGCNPKDYGIE